MTWIAAGSVCGPDQTHARCMHLKNALLRTVKTASKKLLSEIFGNVGWRTDQKW
jgi:hypothetical protein